MKNTSFQHWTTSELPSRRSKKTTIYSALHFILPCLFVALSCTPRPLQLDRWDKSQGYRFETLDVGEGNTDETFVFVSFSGGGTRAAALAYGVLLGLEAMPVGEASMLDEVDMISSVSGGSFSAMAYGLWGKDMFDGRFEERFLRQNVLLDLVLQAVNPVRLLLLPLPAYDSIDLAANYYHQRIFEQSTYADLIRRNRRPFVELNATDTTRKQTFGFTQDEFDLLGSDLATLPTSRAVAASSAFPILLSPMRLEYYPGGVMEAAVQHELDQRIGLFKTRRRRWAESLLLNGSDPTNPPQLDYEKHKYLYLMDGGVSDNLGLHAFFREYGTGCIRKRIEEGRIKRLIVVIVDAATEKPGDLEQSVFAPGWGTSLLATLGSGVENNSKLTSAAVHYLVHQMPYDVEINHGDLETLVVDVDLRSVSSPNLLDQFMSMATSFVLPDRDITALIKRGKTQILENDDLRRISKSIKQH